MNWQKISKKDTKNLGEIPSTPSNNLTRPDPNLTGSRDKRYTGRNVRISLAVRPEFAAELKKVAVANDCYQIELLEKAWECYKQQQNITEL